MRAELWAMNNQERGGSGWSVDVLDQDWRVLEGRKYGKEQKEIVYGLNV